MPNNKTRLIAVFTLAMMTSPGIVAAAEDFPVPPPFRGDVVREHEAQVRHMTLRDLERDIISARTEVTERHFGEAQQSAEFALALANSLVGSSPTADAVERARLHDAIQHIDSAVNLFYEHDPWEARRELKTAQTDVELFARQRAS